MVLGHHLKRIRISQDLLDTLKLWVVDNLILDHVGLSHILALAVHPVGDWGLEKLGNKKIF